MNDKNQPGCIHQPQLVLMPGASSTSVMSRSVSVFEGPAAAVKPTLQAPGCGPGAAPPGRRAA